MFRHEHISAAAEHSVILKTTADSGKSKLEI